MKETTVRKKPEQDILVGKYFHSFPIKEGEKHRRITWQGRVIGKVSEGLYLVQLCEWLFGQPSNQRLVDIAMMMREEWQFYTNDEHWREEGDRLSESAARADESREDDEWDS